MVIMTACGGAVRCEMPFAGDPNLPVEAELAIDKAGQLIIVSDGDAVDLLRPPQGGFVMYAGLRLKNIVPCGVRLRGVVRDLKTDAPLSEFDARSADLVLADGGWWVPPGDFSSIPNVALCPDNTGGSVLNRAVRLEVTATDQRMRVGSASKEITPTCPPGICLPMCECTCGPDYTLGKCANVAKCEP